MGNKDFNSLVENPEKGVLNILYKISLERKNESYENYGKNIFKAGFSAENDEKNGSFKPSIVFIRHRNSYFIHPLVYSNKYNPKQRTLRSSAKASQC